MISPRHGVHFTVHGKSFSTRETVRKLENSLQADRAHFLTIFSVCIKLYRWETHQSQWTFPHCGRIELRIDRWKSQSYERRVTFPSTRGSRARAPSFRTRLKNKPTRVNERETTKRQRGFSLPTISLSQGLQNPPSPPRHLPPVIPHSAKRLGREKWRAVRSLLIPTPHAASSPRPFSSTASSRRHPGSSLENAPFSGGKARATYSAPLSEVVRHRPRCAQPGVEIHSSCPTLRVAVHEAVWCNAEATSGEVLANSVSESLRFPP